MKTRRSCELCAGSCGIYYYDSAIEIKFGDNVYILCKKCDLEFGRTPDYTLVKSLMNAGAVEMAETAFVNFVLNMGIARYRCDRTNHKRRHRINGRTKTPVFEWVDSDGEKHGTGMSGYREKSWAKNFTTRP